MNKLPAAKRAQILTMIIEGVSIRAISRMTGASKNTIVKLLLSFWATLGRLARPIRTPTSGA
jgi:uncharacterized protein YerC